MPRACARPKPGNPSLLNSLSCATLHRTTTVLSAIRSACLWVYVCVCAYVRVSVCTCLWVCMRMREPANFPTVIASTQENNELRVTFAYIRSQNTHTLIHVYMYNTHTHTYLCAGDSYKLLEQCPFGPSPFPYTRSRPANGRHCRHEKQREGN